MPSTLDRVIAIAAETSGIAAKRLISVTAIDQDMRISGGDVIDFIEALAREYGPEVSQWPWSRFAILSEGLSLLFPLMLVWQLLTWPFRGSFEYLNPLERLELGHIAAVIDIGQWLDP